MKILYGFGNCSKTKYENEFSGKKGFNGYAIQRYHHLLINGLHLNGVSVFCFSGLPINSTITSKKIIHENDEIENGVYYHYYLTVNNSILRKFMIFIGGFVNVLFGNVEANTYLICDCLNVANAFGMALAAKLRHIPVVMIVTDLPENEGGRGILRMLNEKAFSLADGFILLTKQMNNKVNKHNKPFIVLEGHTDGSQVHIEEDEKFEVLNGKKIVLYAGSLMKKYGIQNLVEGFILSNISGSELWICGNGDYQSEIEEISKTNDRIKYLGVISNEETIKTEMRVALLVNPRPTKQDYTKYSFPSKNLEYMASGTPILTTVLPGMPEEYHNYVFLLQDESPEGISKSLNDILGLALLERQKVGESARIFVNTEKSNIKQAAKVISFLEEIKE